MKNLHKLLAITGVVAAIAITNVASIAFANAGDTGNTGEEVADGARMMHREALDPERAEEMKQHMEDMKAAIESGDYDAWYALMTENDKTPEILDKINADNFYLLAEMHQKMQDGDTEGAKEIADELGLERPMMKGCGQMARKGMKENREEVKAAIENGDYDAWYALMTEDGRNPQILEKVNADNFYLLAEMHQKMQDGDTEGAKEIAEELGIERPLKRAFKARLQQQQ